jgi:hypothetical protein
MCFSKPKQPEMPDYGAIARQQEAERQARIAQSSQAIESAFGGFGDDFYSGVSDAFMKYYLPQVDEQYVKAGNQLRKMGTQSSTYQKRVGELATDYERQKAQIAGQAADQAAQQRAKVAQQKGTLLQLAMSGGDPTLVANQAAATVQGIQAPQSFSPLGDLFAKYSGQYGMSQALANPNAAGRQAGTPSLLTDPLQLGNVRVLN